MGDLNPLEAEFVRASQLALQQIEYAKEAARQRELTQAHALAEEQKRRAEQEVATNAKLRYRFVLLTIASILAALLLVAALLATRQAQIKTIEAQHNADAAAAALSIAQANAVTATVALGKFIIERATAQAAKAIVTEQVEMVATSDAYAEQSAARADSAAAELVYSVARIIENSLALPTSGRATPTPEYGAAEPPLAEVPQIELETPTPTATLYVPATSGNEASNASAPIGDACEQLCAVLPAIDVDLFVNLAIEASEVITVRGPLTLPVIDVNPNYVRVEPAPGVSGWVRIWLPTYLGDPERLPREQRCLVVSNQDDVPFTNGVVISYGGAYRDFLLSDQHDEQSGVLEVPVGTPVTLLFTAEGSTSYGSGIWYYVSLVDPQGENRPRRGYLPAEVIGPQ